MKRLVLIILPILFVILFSCGSKESAKERAAKDSIYLHQAPVIWDSLYNAKDVQGIVNLYTDDVVSMPFDLSSVVGKKMLQADFENFFKQNQDPRHQTLVDELLITDSFSIERARYTLTYTPLSSGKHIIETGRHVMCRKRINGEWKIAWEIYNTDRPVQ